MSLVLACGDDGTGNGSSGEGTSTETSATDSATESATATASDSAEAGTDSMTSNTDSDSESATETETDSGDGDGDSGDGDGDSGDGDGDSGDGDGDSGDGDGDSGDGDGDSGDGDGDSGSGDGDGDSGDGDGDTETDTDMPCQESVGEVAPIPPSVMFLLDRSGSMTVQGFDLDDPLKTRWQALYEAVDMIVTGNDAQIAFGAKTFSTQGQGSCGVSNLPDVDIELNNANNILAGIPGPMEQVNGGTPTNLALEKTMTIMEFFDAEDSDKFIFLITDGRIGCLDDNIPEEEAEAQALADAVAVLEDGLMNHAITTYVVGIAPSNNGPILGQLEGMAIAGGAPKPGLEAFYRADDADQLAEALDAVLQDSYGKSCLLNLDEPPFFPEYTKVQVGQNLYELVDNCDNEDGFVYTNDEFTQIQLCGLACEDLGNLGIDESAEVQFFCNPG